MLLLWYGYFTIPEPPRYAGNAGRLIKQLKVKGDDYFDEDTYMELLLKYWSDNA